MTREGTARHEKARQGTRRHGHEGTGHEGTEYILLSGITELFDSKDDVMADKGFIISELLAKRNAIS